MTQAATLDPPVSGSSVKLEEAIQSGASVPKAALSSNSATENGLSLRARHARGEPATIGKNLTVRGEISGTDSITIEGTVEGSIRLDGKRVIIARNGVAIGLNGLGDAEIVAGEIVVFGKVRGNLTATDLVVLRAECSVIGDVCAAHVNMEDGAFFKGGIYTRKPVSA